MNGFGISLKNPKNVYPALLYHIWWFFKLRLSLLPVRCPGDSDFFFSPIFTLFIHNRHKNDLGKLKILMFK